MLVMMPMSPTSPCATKPVAMERMTDHTQRITTRWSMKARSIGTLGSVMSGATGMPSVVVAPSRLKSLRCRIRLFCHAGGTQVTGRGIIFEEHRSRPFVGADAVDDLFEHIGE